MVNNIGDIAATATLDIEPFQQNTRNLKTYLRGVDVSLKGLEQSFKNSGKELGSMKALYSQTGSALRDYQTLLDKQKEKYEQLVTETGDLNKATVEQKQAIAGARAEMMTTASKVENLKGKYSELSKEMATQESMFTRFGDKAVGFGKNMETVGGGLEKVGNTATKFVTAPLALGIGAVTKAAIDWESAFVGVKKTVDEVTDSTGKVTYSYKDLEKGLRDVSKELPSSHQEIAAVAEAAGQLGIQTPNVVSFTKTMIDLGESTNMSAETAATELARFANITGMSQDKFNNLGSALVDLGKSYCPVVKKLAA